MNLDVLFSSNSFQKFSRENIYDPKILEKNIQNINSYFNSYSSHQNFIKINEEYLKCKFLFIFR